MLFPEVWTQVPEGYVYITTFCPNGARASVVERDDDNLTAEEMREHSAAAQAAKVKGFSLGNTISVSPASHGSRPATLSMFVGSLSGSGLK
eukprot:14778-Lingulodinium_polyedra.AAC.1